MTPFWTRPSSAPCTTFPRPGAAQVPSDAGGVVPGLCAPAGRTVLMAKAPAPRAATMLIVPRSFFIGAEGAGPLLAPRERVNKNLEGSIVRMAGHSSHYLESQPEWDGELYAANTGHHRRYDDAFLATLPLRTTDRVLDIGCGSGDFTATVAALVPDGHVVGLEPQPSLIHEARR